MSNESWGTVLNPDWIKMRKGKHQTPETEPRISEATFAYSYTIVNLAPDGAGERAGLKPHDSIIQINGHAPVDGDALGISREVQSWNGEAKLLRVRDVYGKERDVNLKPQWNESSKRWIVGIGYFPSKFFAHHNEQSGERLRYPFEIRNDKDEIAATGYIILGKEEEGTRGVQRQVEKYILSGHQKDGTPMEYDVLARFNTTDAKIYWRPDLQKAWGLCHGEKEVSIKYIDDAHSLHTLLHELRHTFQRTEQIFGDLHWDYESVIEEDYTDDEKWTRKIQTEYGIKIIKKILSFIYQEDEVNRILQGLNTEKWKVDIENLELAERELGSFSKRKRELRDDYERKVSDLPRTVFRKHLHPLIPKENYAKMRSLFASAQNPLESLLQAKTFYANGEITHDTDQQIVADIFRSLKNGFSAEDAADQYGVWHLIFDWDKAIIDPVTNTLTLERKYRQIGIRFEMNPNNPIPLEDLKEKIESEFEVEKNKLQLEYASEQMKLENEKARAHEMVQQASAHLPNAQTLIFGSVRMVDVLRLPTFLIERDAEYGALIGLRAIKKECGINFLQSFHPNPEDVSDPKKTKKIDSIANIESYMERIGIAKEVIAQINAKRVMNANGKILLKR